MSKNTIFGVLAIVAIVAGLLWFARPAATIPTTPAAVVNSVSPSASTDKTFDFGTVSIAKGKVTHDFLIKNDGATPLRLTKMYTSCMCTEAELLMGDQRFGPFGMPGHMPIPPIDVAVAPGAETTVRATFDPAAHGPAGVGRISRVVTLETAGGEPLEFEFTATVTP